MTLLLLIYGWVTIEYPANFIPIFEYTIPVTASWWSIFLFRDILEESGSETIFTYPMPRWKLGLAKVLLFFLLYLSLLLLMLFILELRSSESIFLLLALQLGIQAFFYGRTWFLVDGHLCKYWLGTTIAISIHILSNTPATTFAAVFYFFSK